MIYYYIMYACLNPELYVQTFSVSSVKEVIYR